MNRWGMTCITFVLLFSLIDLYFIYKVYECFKAFDCNVFILISEVFNFYLDMAHDVLYAIR